MDDNEDKKSGGSDAETENNPATGNRRPVTPEEVLEQIEAARAAAGISPSAELHELAKRIGVRDFGLTPTPAEQVSAVNTLIKHAESRVGELAARLDTFPEYIEQMKAELERQQIAHEAFRRIVSDPLTELEGFRAKIVEDLKLKEARQLWTNRATRARKEYVGSCFVLAILLVLVPALAIWQSEAIFGFFRSIGEAVLVDLPDNASETAILIAAVSRLVLVTMPVALYIWLIRIVVRFNMRSLLLIDDAEQRNTMLETYLHLVERDADVKADRPLILEALFRRTPGHGPETIEPPNLADVMRLGGKPSGPT